MLLQDMPQSQLGEELVVFTIKTFQVEIAVYELALQNQKAEQWCSSEPGAGDAVFWK